MTDVELPFEDAPAAKPKRAPAKKAAAKPVEPAGKVYLCGAKPLRMGAMILEPGDPVPGAAGWPRVDAWVRARRLVEA